MARTSEFQNQLLQWQASIAREPRARDSHHQVSFGPTRSETQDHAIVDNRDSANHDVPARGTSVSGAEGNHPSAISGHAIAGRTEALAGEVVARRSVASDDACRLAVDHRITAPDAACSGQSESPANAVARDEVASSELSRLAADHQIAAAAHPGGHPMADSDPSAIDSRTLVTGFGGTFFLINVALLLNIYTDFTLPLGQNLELNIWDFLTLVGAELVGSAIETDPIVEAFAALAGRGEGQRPGALFTPPLEWRLPGPWLDAFPEPYEPQEVINNHRLVSMHPAGFPILDVADGAFSAQPPVDPLKRWLGWLSAYLRARLIRAMGRNDGVALLCCLPARAAYTSTHVDVTFSLNHHPFEIRFAGLDRDPGWVPAAGRYVAFHFD
jgi:hypothetical protein